MAAISKPAGEVPAVSCLSPGLKLAFERLQLPVKCRGAVGHAPHIVIGPHDGGAAMR
jgi:hypothetical protein